MLFSLLHLALAATASALPHDPPHWGPPGHSSPPHGPPHSFPTHPSAPKPTVWLAGDSTMAPGGGGNGTEGWGQYLHYSLTTPVINAAIAGRSARSYTREGRFANLTSLVSPGDIVVIEFGHNDGTSKPDNGRSDCPGNGTEVCHYVYAGVNETVLTFNAYIEGAARNLTARGAHVVLSSQTPDNPDETQKYVYAAPRFVGLMQLAANRTGMPFVDHFNATDLLYEGMSVAEVNRLFPMDHTHTSPVGAALVAQAFVRGVICAGWRNNPLLHYVVNATAEVEGSCTGV